MCATNLLIMLYLSVKFHQICFLRGHNKNLVKIQKVEEAFKNNGAPVLVFRCVNSVVHNIFSDGSVAVNNVCCSLKQSL